MRKAPCLVHESAQHLLVPKLRRSLGDGSTFPSRVLFLPHSFLLYQIVFFFVSAVEKRKKLTFLDKRAKTRSVINCTNTPQYRIESPANFSNDFVNYTHRHRAEPSLGLHVSAAASVRGGSACGKPCSSHYCVIEWIGLGI